MNELNMAKKKLKLEVKSLETRVAPGQCYNTHAGIYTDDGVNQASWDSYHERMEANEGGHAPPAGTPIIGIN